jgi:acetolactate synthase small subunit
MRALLYAEGGNLDHLFESNVKIYQIIGENWVRAEKVMIKVPLPHNRFEDIEELISTSKERKYNK